MLLEPLLDRERLGVDVIFESGRIDANHVRLKRRFGGKCNLFDHVVISGLSWMIMPGSQGGYFFDRKFFILWAAVCRLGIIRVAQFEMPGRNPITRLWNLRR